ncbi:MAG TPA: hypothetical protein VEI97_20250, partial [bacterium]|nr:hypothetical protein [bacterium]
LFSSCAAHDPATGPVNSNTTTGAPGLGAIATRGDLGQAALGLYDMRIDPAAGTAAVEVLATRTAQQTDDVYQLSVGDFMRAPALEVLAVRQTATTVDVAYKVSHPFGAPADLSAPASATNRADLGIAGRVLFLADVPSPAGNTFFGDTVLNATLVTNADGYIEPRGLLGLSGFTANAFPFKVLVDEPVNLRTNTATGTPISNEDRVIGNYDPAEGWQADNIGPDRAGWTGFGVLHQGQSATNQVKFSRADLAAAPFNVRVAILAKYVDPRGGTTAAEKRANRLPSQPASITNFVYREPHGALDVERIQFVGATGTFVADAASPVTLRFKVVDWDARAAETSQADLALSTNPMAVAQGEAGPPTLAVSIPGVTGGPASEIALTQGPKDDDSVHAGDPARDTGRPRDALFYEETVTKPAGGGQSAGTFTGLVRAIDPEAFANAAAWKFALGPGLTPLGGGDVPEDAVYQTFTVNQAPAGGWVTHAGNGFGADFFRVLVKDGTILVGGYFEGTTDFGGGPRTPAQAGISDGVVVRYDAAGTYLWDYAFGGSGEEYIGDLAVDANGNIYLVGVTSSPSITFGGPTHTVVDYDGFIVRLGADGRYQTDFQVGGNSYEDVETLDIGADGNLVLSGFFDDGPLTALGGPPLSIANDGAYLAKMTPTFGHVWSKAIDGPLFDVIQRVALDSGNNVYAGISFQSTVDFGGGVRDFNYGTAIVKYTPAGAWVWDRTYYEGGHDAIQGLDVRGGTVAVSGYITQGSTIDFGGGPVVGSFGGVDVYLAAFEAANGAYKWAVPMGGNSADDISGLAIDSAGNIITAGTFRGVASFGGPNRTATGVDDLYAVKRGPNGAYVWDSVVEGTNVLLPESVATDGTDVFVGGVFRETVDFNPGAGLASRTASGEDGFLLKLRGSNGIW